MLTTSNRLKFKLASGTHGLRSELSGKDNENITRVVDKEETVEEILLQPMYSSDDFQKELFDGDDAHRCIIFYAILKLLFLGLQRLWKTNV
eukprot:Awhi_evm1s14196